MSVGRPWGAASTPVQSVFSATRRVELGTLLQFPPHSSRSKEPLLSGLDVSRGPAFVRGNLRGHLVRGSLRLISLLAIDTAAIITARRLIRTLRTDSALPVLGDFVRDVFPRGELSGPQLIIAVLIALFALGAYRAGDHWTDPVRVLAATGVGVILALYSDLWRGDPLGTAGRGFLIWIALGLLLVIGRVVSSWVASRFLQERLQHRVVEIFGDRATGDHVELGPSYTTVATLRASDLPADLDALEKWLENGVDTILAAGQIPAAQFGALTDFALTHGCRLLCVPRATQLVGVDTKRMWVGGHPILELTAPGLRASQLVLKRALDIVVGVVTLLLLAPILVAVAIWVRLDSPGPIFFRQSRPGFQGVTFPMLKFRSMRVDAEEVLHADAELYALFLENDCKLPEAIDPRITKSGRFLRKTSLDELPQLFNVLRGEMSIVGPRPLVGPELENYGTAIPTLLSVKPGMTGLWQVKGRSSITFPERAELDLEYVRRWSFLRDLWILALTPPAILVGRGAH